MAGFSRFARAACRALSAVTAACLLAACGDLETNVERGTREQVLHIGNGTEPQDLDPHIVTGVTENNLVVALLEPLVSIHPATLAPEPGVAESWEIAPDGREYTFHLRNDARWSNGDPVTAEDFVYAWQRLLSPRLGAEYAYQLYAVVNAKKFHTGQLTDFSRVGVRAVDAHTLHVTLNHAVPYFLGLLNHQSLMPVHRPTIERWGRIDERGTLWTRAGNFVGNGPFVLDEWTLNRIIVMKKNPLYWDAGRVRLNAIHFYPIDNVTTEERMFRTGTLHLTYSVPSEKVPVYQREDPELIRVDPYLGSYFYYFNTTRPPLDDPRVRLALAMTVDRERIVTRITKSGQLPSYTLTPPDTAGYTATPQFGYSIERARELLAEAGYPDGRGFPHLEILYNTHEDHQKIAVAIQQMWKTALNIDVGLYNQDWKVYLDSTTRLDFEIARASWIGDYNDPNTFLDMFITGGGNNRTGWSNPEYDRLIAQAARTGDRTARYALLAEAEAILLRDAPILPIYTYVKATLIVPDVRGWHPNIQDLHPYKYVYLEASGPGG